MKKEISFFPSFLFFFFLIGINQIQAGHRSGGNYSIECLDSVANLYKICQTSQISCSSWEAINPSVDEICIDIFPDPITGSPVIFGFSIDYDDPLATVTIDSVYREYCPELSPWGCNNDGYNWNVFQTICTEMVINPVYAPYTISSCLGGGMPAAANIDQSISWYTDFQIHSLQCNSSPIKDDTTKPLSFCVGQLDTIINNFNDPDGDSLFFYLADCEEDYQDSVDYVDLTLFGYSQLSGSNPWPSSIGWLIDQSTGNISFQPEVHPNIISLDKPVINLCLEVEEWDTTGVVPVLLTSMTYYQVVELAECDSFPDLPDTLEIILPDRGVLGGNWHPTYCDTFALDSVIPGRTWIIWDSILTWDSSGVMPAYITHIYDSVPTDQDTSFIFCWETICGFPAGDYHFYVPIMDNACQFRNEMILDIHVVPGGIPFAHFLYMGDSCGSMTLNFEPLFTSPDTDHQWDFGDPVSGVQDTSSLFAPSHTFTSPGNYTVTLIVGNTCASDTIEIDISVPVLDTAFAGQDLALCHDASEITLSQAIGSQGPISYNNWQVISPHPGGGFDNNNLLNTTYHFSEEDSLHGFALLELSVNGPNCPLSRDTIMIVLFPTYSPEITGPAYICNEDLSCYEVSDLSLSTISWSNTCIACPSNANNNDYCVDWHAGAGFSGSDTITVVQTSVNGCSTTSSIVVTSDYTSPTIAGSQILCVDDTATYENIDAIVGESHSWNISGGTISSATPDSFSVQVLWDEPGTGALSLTTQSPTGCDSTVSISVTVNGMQAQVIDGKTHVCTNSQNTYCVIDQGNGYDWLVIGGTIVSGQNTECITVEWGQQGSGSVELTETSGSCQTITNLATLIDVTPQPIISGDTSVCVGDTSMYCIDGSISNGNSWSVANGSPTGMQTTDCYEVVWTAPGTGEVSVSETSPNCSCTGESDLEVIVCDTVINGLEEFPLHFDGVTAMRVFPNPTSGWITVELGKSYNSLLVSISNLQGKTISKKSLERTERFDLDFNAPSGCYFLSVKTDSGENKVTKLIKH